MLMRSLADVSKKGHFRDLARMSPSPYDTSRLSAISDCERERERENKEGEGKERERES